MDHSCSAIAHGGGIHVQLWLGSDGAFGDSEVGLDNFSPTSVKTRLVIRWSD